MGLAKFRIKEKQGEEAKKDKTASYINLDIIINDLYKRRAATIDTEAITNPRIAKKE